MRRLSVALIANLVWLSAALLAGGCLVLFGAGLVTYLAVAVLLSLAFALTTWLGLRAERAFRARLVTVGGALGLKEHEATSIEAIVSSLCQRLDRAQQFKSAFQHMRHPAMLVSPEGKLTGLSAGTEALDGRAGEGVELAGLFGEASAATNAAGEHIVTLGRRRFAAARHDLPAGRVLVELQPSGHHIADDDFEAFVAALGNGRTGFRFDDWSMQHSPGLRALGQALESLDKPLRALQQLLVGDEVDRALLSGTSPFALQVRQFHDAIEEILAERDEAISQRDLLEAKMEAILRAIDRYRASVTSLAELADQSRAGLAVAAGAIGKGRERARAVRELEREAVQLTTDAALAVQRAGQAVDGVGSATREIDKMVSAIEDVSFRTNLLALNAAVEAARAGEKGAGFAVVAGEVRTLAQATQKAAKEIRSMVGSSRARSDQSAAETEQLKKILTGLGSHLENLSNETDMIAGALDEGSGAFERLDSSVNAVGTVAAKALQLPARKKSAS